MFNLVITTLVATLLTANVWAQNQMTQADYFNRYMGLMNEAKAYDQLQNQGKPQQGLSSLMSAYICVSSKIANIQQIKAFQNIVEKSVVEAFAQVPMGTELLEHMRKKDPSLFKFDLEEVASDQSCKKEISDARAKYSETAVREMLILAEFSGHMLGLYMTQK